MTLPASSSSGSTGEEIAILTDPDHGSTRTSAPRIAPPPILTAVSRSLMPISSSVAANFLGCLIDNSWSRSPPMTGEPSLRDAESRKTISSSDFRHCSRLAREGGLGDEPPLPLPPQSLPAANCPPSSLSEPSQERRSKSSIGYHERPSLRRRSEGSFFCSSWSLL